MVKPALTSVLLASAALVFPFSHAAGQANVGDQNTPSQQDTTARKPSRVTEEEIVVIGQRRGQVGGGLIKPQKEAKSISTISSEYIRTQSAIQNAYQYVQLSPGALVAMSDPYGLSEQSSINVHGLGQDELGYVLEGMPLNDIGFYTAYPSQFIDSENIDEISLSQGSADLDSPVISAAGGLMKITMLDPSVEFGGLADVGFGTYNMNREFLRMDSGLLADTNLRLFLSYSHTGADQWRGPGRVKRQHIDFKTVNEWGDGNRVTLTATYHDGITPTYTLPTLTQFKQYGTDYNFAPSFAGNNPGYWPLNTGTFRILYMSAPSIFVLTDNLTLNMTPYWQYGYGNSPYGTTLTQTGNFLGTEPVPFISIPNYNITGGVVEANYQDLQYRTGNIIKFTYTTGPNSIIAGYWFDYSDETDTESYSSVSPQGLTPDTWVDTDRGTIKLPNGQLFLAGRDHVVTQTHEFFLADVLHLLDDALTIEAGVKVAIVSRSGTNLVPGPQYAAAFNDSELLPRAAARYQIDPEDMVFASVTTNFRTPSEATLFNSYYGGAIYSPANTNLKPEYSVSEEVGYRYTGELFTGSVAYFHYDFSDRQIATVVGVNGNDINYSINAGGQTTDGVDVELGTKPIYGFSPYISAEYLHSTIDNDLPIDGDFLPTKGKSAVRSPPVQVALGIKYDNGDFFANLNVKYVDDQYSTFMNDEKIPSYETVDLGVGYRLPDIGLRARPEIKLNLINLTGDNYLSGVANPTANATTVKGRFGTMFTGNSPAYYLSGGFSMAFTATQAF
jgi:outer membrane receptor protein involved in Fe transport